MFEHRIAYPLTYLHEPVRVLLANSQTNVTADPEAGLQYAAAAYDKTQLDLTTELADPTAAGEAAAKAGFRAAQAGYDFRIFDKWFEVAKGHLKTEEPHFQRELITAHLLSGRARSLMLLRPKSWEVMTDRDVSVAASTEFRAGEEILQAQHQRSKSWDPYATMLARHWATHEAIHGDPELGAKMAARGIWRAIRAKQETANTPAGFVKHGKFVMKQATSNTVAGMLAKSRPLRRISAVKKLQDKMALTLLG